MKMSYLPPQSDDFKKLKISYDKNDKFAYGRYRKDDNSAGAVIKSNPGIVLPFLTVQTMHKKLYKNDSCLTKNVDTNRIGERNNSNSSLNWEPKINKTSGDLFNVIKKDTDSFYDNELVRKISDDEGNLPEGLNLIGPPGKDPLLVYNESGDAPRLNLEKREKRSMQTNMDDDYVYYEELQNGSKTNFEKALAQKGSTYGNLINHLVKNQEDQDFGISDASFNIATREQPIASTAIPIEDMNFAEPSTIGKSEDSLNDNSNFKDAMVKISNSFSGKLISAVKGKEPPRQGSRQNCHPNGGLPKNPGMPPLPKRGQDREYEKLLKGEISERVAKGVLDKIKSNSQLATELGICDFDIGELRTLFKEARTKDKKDCCLKLRGEFKCFLNWLLTVEPSRKKRSEDVSLDRINGLGTCNSQFPKFDIMGPGDYYKPSRQYENLAHKVAEYADGEDNL